MAFLSDVHGNLEALEAVLGELARRGVKDIYVAGDHLLGGEAPLEVFDTWRFWFPRQVGVVMAHASLLPSRIELVKDQLATTAKRSSLGNLAGNQEDARVHSKENQTTEDGVRLERARSTKT